MRTLGDIPHSRYKVTILEMSAKITIQIEDGMLMQSYRFRDGAAVTNVPTAITFCDAGFFSKVEQVFNQMQNNMVQASERSISGDDPLPNFI